MSDKDSGVPDLDAEDVKQQEVADSLYQLEMQLLHYRDWLQGIIERIGKTGLMFDDDWPKFTTFYELLTDLGTHSASMALADARARQESDDNEPE